MSPSAATKPRQASATVMYSHMVDLLSTCIVPRYKYIVLRYNRDRGSWQSYGMSGLSHADYANLLRFRTSLRRFDSWSHEQARRVGLTHAQHQLLLAIKGHDDPLGPTIGEAATYLNTRHHSVVGLIDRAEAAGLLHRVRDDADARAVRLQLTALGEHRLAQLSELH